MEPRISIITLGVADMAHSIRFYRDGLGFPTIAQDNHGWAIFATNGTRLSLFPYDALGKDISPDKVDSGRATERPFSGVTLAHNVASKAEVDAVLDAAVAAGATLLKSAQTASWGGYSGYFADPDGYAWEVAWGDGWEYAEDGTLYGGPLGPVPS